MKLTLKNVRLSFPHLFQKATFSGNETKFEATFLLHKESQADQIKALKTAIAEKLKTDLKGAKLAADKICLRDGDEVAYDGYAGHFSIKASNNKRPVVIDRDKSPLTEDDNRIYAGCYVNVIVELWAQDNQYGKRINANLLGVQFAKDGEPFGDGGVSASADDFESLDDEEDIAF
jgi:hypothetical protein